MSATHATVSRCDRIAVDIGSTVIKIARISRDGRVSGQVFHPRNFDVRPSDQLASILADSTANYDNCEILVCSSANGGLRVGIVCLTEIFSGSLLRNQALLAGANPIFVYTFANCQQDARYVDVLVVGGGIDSPDSGPLGDSLRQ